MKKYLQLIRVEQYVKNIFVFAPLFFGGEFLNLNLFFKTTIAFFSFCAISSCVYIINDYFDIEEDKLHPTKSKRPLSAGTIKKQNALFLAFTLFLISFCLTIYININATIYILIYLVLNFLYTIKLKKIAILDLNIIAVGFVLRILVGGFVVNIEPSMWILIETFVLALFLALAKRRTDFVLFTNGILVRESIKGYNLIFIDIVLGFLSAILIVCYLFYCISPAIESHYHSNLVYVSTIFVLNGLLRYLKLALVDQTTYSPTLIVLKDRFIQVCILGWILFLSFLLYFN